MRLKYSFKSVMFSHNAIKRRVFNGLFATKNEHRSYYKNNS